MKILKFGGSSVAEPDRIRQMLAIVGAAPAPSVVVVSAFGGTTDTLVSLGKKAAAREDWLVDLETLADRHESAVHDLVSEDQVADILEVVVEHMDSLKQLLTATQTTQHVTPRMQDELLSFGERLSAFIIASAGQSMGMGTYFADARDFIITDDTHTQAQIDFSKTKAKLASLETQNIPIMTGFIGSTPEGVTTTLGRGGSDFTASIVGACLQASEIQIWTDVSGVLTADPRMVHDAQAIAEMSYNEAMELSHFGAKVIYSPTILPARDAEIPLVIKNTFSPDAPGTKICLDPEPSDGPVRGLSVFQPVSLLRLSGPGLQGLRGAAGRLFTALGQAEINVMLITQSSSEQHICFAIEPHHAEKAVDILLKTFELELHREMIRPPTVEHDFAIISVVGDRMAYTPGVSAQVFGALGDAGVNVHAIAQGSSERNISIVIDLQEAHKALTAVHTAFFHANISVFVAGDTGTVGSALVEQIDRLDAEQISIAARCNSRRISFANGEEEASSPSRFINIILDSVHPRTVFADCTGGDFFIDHYGALLKKGVRIATPNKQGLSKSQHTFDELAPHLNEIGIEANVGAGLPVIGTLKKLLETGDRISKIECVASGTLSYLLNTYDGQTPFSTLVAEAQKAGYTEPDPRDDLSGLDVGRKILILARLCGHRGELADMDLTPLMNSQTAEADFENVYEALESYNNVFHAAWEKAQKENKKLCYTAQYDCEKGIMVGLQTVDETHPFFGLSGAENAFCFWTDTYTDIPLTVRGPGAGPAVTAQGVLADILSFFPAS